MTDTRLLISYGLVSYDDQDESLIEIDANGDTRTLASNVPQWFGRLVVERLADGREYDRLLDAARALLYVLGDLVDAQPEFSQRLRVGRAARDLRTAVAQAERGTDDQT